MPKKRKRRIHVGSVISMVLSATDYVEPFTPQMRLIAATLMPFSDRFWSWAAGPQPKSKHYDKDEPPYIEIQVPHSHYPDSSVYIKITESSVTYWESIKDCDGDFFIDGEGTTTLDKVFRYLAALPSTPGYHLFDKGE